MKFASVYFNEIYCGELREADDHYEFEYDSQYLVSEFSRPVSLSLPLKKEIYKSDILFPFFDGLIPEGYLLDLLMNKYKVKATDRFDLLIYSGLDTIGAVTVKEK